MTDTDYTAADFLDTDRPTNHSSGATTMTTTTSRPTDYTATRRYVVKASAACMPLSCWGRYARIAVLETDGRPASEISMISDRARGVIRVVETWERLFIGKTDNCAYGRAELEAMALAARLNNSLP